MKATFEFAFAALLPLVGACGSAPEPAITTAAPVAPATPTETPTAAARASTPAATPAPASAGTGLTKNALMDANKIVMSAYPGPFDKTYSAVTAKIGEPKKKGANMYEWFAQDGERCVQFFMTKDAKKGHAASGISDADASSCK